MAANNRTSICNGKQQEVNTKDFSFSYKTRSPELNNPAGIQLLRNADENQGSFSLSAPPFLANGLLFLCLSLHVPNWLSSLMFAFQAVRRGKVTGTKEALPVVAISLHWEVKRSWKS